MLEQAQASGPAGHVGFFVWNVPPAEVTGVEAWWWLSAIEPCLACPQMMRVLGGGVWPDGSWRCSTQCLGPKRVSHPGVVPPRANRVSHPGVLWPLGKRRLDAQSAFDVEVPLLPDSGPQMACCKLTCLQVLCRKFGMS